MYQCYLKNQVLSLGVGSHTSVDRVFGLDVHPLFLGSLKLSLSQVELLKDLLMVAKSLVVLFVDGVNDEAEVLLRIIGFLILCFLSELDLSLSACDGASGCSHTHSVIFLNKAGALNLLDNGLLLWCFWCWLNLGSWYLLRVALVLECNLVRKLVGDSCLEERHVFELVPIGVNPFLKESV